MPVGSAGKWARGHADVARGHAAVAREECIERMPLTSCCMAETGDWVRRCTCGPSCDNCARGLESGANRKRGGVIGGVEREERGGAFSYVSEVSDKANTTVGAETHTKADAKTETDCRALVDSEHVASMWKAARGRQRMADALQQGMRASRPAGERFLGVRSRVLLGAALRRHPWAALLHVRPDAGPHQAARQVAALFGSWVAMLAAIATVNYYRGAALCTESRTLLGCDTLPTDYSLPFQSCMGAGSCEELYSSHLCGSHDTCHEEFQVKSGGEWWRATMTALVVCSIIPPLLRDLPMLAAPRLPCASRATAALSYAAGRGVCAICGALAAVLERCRWLAMALGTRWHFWRETQLRGRSPWSVFQELEAKEAVRSVKAASDHSILNIKQQPPHWTPAGVRLLCRANVGLEKKVREE
ncbi:hypothetical protein CYMTET_7198 [Cymbomonas tetramitiformis]|uniref:Uncharacterized protein n=1 Tax=Cymbomonas tetramitiformis TaxID=36881 RepID=A0AAE0LHP9_9CHLO|nr:hypothetical protein CYMTET_7198 [Cymbomonas tetramitiformis]